VKHPNILFDLYDRNIQVFRDRPTITTIKIPTNIFENTPIEDTPEANLGPVQQRLDELTETGERQANKLGGQPIYADDWNEMATTVANLSRSTRELTELVAPNGHDHPEIVEKIEEIQRNIQSFYEVFGQAIAQIQRQMQALALQRKVESTLEKVHNIPPERRRELEELPKRLAESWLDSPGVYNAKKRRAAEQIQSELVSALAEATPDIRDDDDVKDLQGFTLAMATERPVISYAEEVTQQQRANKNSSKSIVGEALNAGRIANF